MNHRIGIGIITCDREGFFRRCVSSIPTVDRIVVVNDGKEYDSASYPSGINELVQHRRRCGVGESKNDAIRWLLDAGCDHLFLCEDDVALVDHGIIPRYIRAGERAGIQHFNFGYHGPMNRTASGDPAPRHRRSYPGGDIVTLNRHLVGAFSYYTRGIIQSVGYMDTFYRNAYEHVDHTYRIIRSGGHPPFGWFADIDGSGEAIQDLDASLEHSVIRRNGVAQRLRMKVFSRYFRWKHGRYPWELTEGDERAVDEWLQGHSSPVRP